MKLEELILENSLFADQAAKDDLLKNNVDQIKDLFWINTLGIFALHQKFAKSPKIVKFLRNVDKTRVKDIDDSANDMAVATKLAFDAGFITQPFVNEFTRLLFILKTKPDTAVDEVKLRELFNKIIYTRVIPGPRIKDSVKNWLDGKKNLIDLVFPFFYLSKYGKHSNEFQALSKFFYAKIAKLAIDAKNNNQNIHDIKLDGAKDITKGRGRPRKNPVPVSTVTPVAPAITSVVTNPIPQVQTTVQSTSSLTSTPVVKRGRGRPRKNPIPVSSVQTPSVTSVVSPTTLVPAQVVAPKPIPSANNDLFNFVKGIEPNDYIDSSVLMAVIDAFDESKAINLLTAVKGSKAELRNLFINRISHFARLVPYGENTSTFDVIKNDYNKPVINQGWQTTHEKIKMSYTVKSKRDFVLKYLKFVDALSLGKKQTYRIIHYPPISDKKIDFWFDPYNPSSEFIKYLSLFGVNGFDHIFEIAFLLKECHEGIYPESFFQLMRINWKSDTDVKMFILKKYMNAFINGADLVSPTSVLVDKKAALAGELYWMYRSAVADAEDGLLKEFVIKFKDVLSVEILKKYNLIDNDEAVKKIVFEVLKNPLNWSKLISNNYFDKEVDENKTFGFEFILDDLKITKEEIWNTISSNVSSSSVKYFDNNIGSMVYAKMYDSFPELFNYLVEKNIEISITSKDNFKNRRLFIDLERYTKLYEEETLLNRYTFNMEWISLFLTTDLLSGMGYSSDHAKVAAFFFSQPQNDFNDKAFDFIEKERVFGPLKNQYYALDPAKYYDGDSDKKYALREKFFNFGLRHATINELKKSLPITYMDFFFTKYDPTNDSDINMSLSLLERYISNDTSEEYPNTEKFLEKFLSFGDTNGKIDMIFNAGGSSYELSFIRSLLKIGSKTKSLIIKDAIVKYVKSGKEYEKIVNSKNIGFVVDNVVTTESEKQKVINDYSSRLHLNSSNEFKDLIENGYAEVVVKTMEKHKNYYPKAYGRIDRMFDDLELDKIFGLVQEHPTMSTSEKKKTINKMFSALSLNRSGADRLPMIVNKYLANTTVKNSLNDAKDNSLIPILKRVSEADMEKILKFNNFTVEIDKVNRFKPKKETPYDFLIRNKNYKPIIPEPNVKKIEEDMEELKKRTVQYTKYYNKNHGRTGAEFLESFDVNLPSEELQQWKKENPDHVIVPAFHATGSIAASMILRFGFKIVKKAVGGVAVTGKMLGDGVYFSNIISKSIQYLGDDGFNRSIGTVGYLFEMNAYIGQKNRDYKSAGTDGRDGIRSPEWCVFNPRAQLEIVKAHKVKMVSYDKIKEMKQEYPDLSDYVLEERGYSNFKTFLKEETGSFDGLYYPNFVFYDGNVVGENGKILSVFDWFNGLSAASKKMVEISSGQDGPMVTITTNIPNEFVSAHVPDIEEFKKENPDGLYDYWKKITKNMN